jgi:hypothetical protein
MECPTCDKELDTEQGVRMHHTRVHDVTLPNRQCKGCGTWFYDPQSRRKFCDGCDPNAGKHNGNWSGAKEGADCERCGTTFEYYPSDKRGVYCSECVAESDEFLGDSYTKDAERVEKECDQCGGTMDVLQSKLDRGDGRFCSRNCLGDWLSENVVGEDHHMWKEGKSSYTGDWVEVRDDARDRDEHECQVCGVTRVENGQRLDVHHIQPVREFEDPQDAHRLDNVVSLCRSCHAKVERGSIPTPAVSDER